MVPPADRTQSPSASMYRQIRAPITMSFAKRNKEAKQERAKFILKKKQHTEHSCTRKKVPPIFAHADHFRTRFEPEYVEMP